MYTKFITKSNWEPIYGNYVFDKTVTLNNEFLASDGGMNAVYMPMCNNVKDYANNNYSMFFLTNQRTVDSFLNLQKPTNYSKNTPCLIAHNFLNKLVSESTIFLTLSTHTVDLKNIRDFNNSFYVELLFLDSNRVIIYNLQGKTYTGLSIDILDNKLKIVNLQANPYTLSNYEKNKICFNYIFDKKTKNIVFYKELNNSFLLVLKTDTGVLSAGTGYPDYIDSSNVFTVIDVLDLPSLQLKTDFVSYKTTFGQNNIDINKSKTLYNVSNNFLGHLEYNTVREDKASFNFITLKNQLNITDNQNRIYNKDNSFRGYTTILGGGKREEGYSNLNLNYQANNITFKFPSDKTTWFHIPFTSGVKTLNINETSFFKNGAIAGSTPLYSDKIWKKLANYSNNTTFKSSTTLENTGQWLCSWLSGGNNNAVWVDRFYDSSAFTPFEALKYNPNVDYVPQYEGLYTAGINDHVSKLNMEPGSWYAYYHLGKQSASNILKSLTGSIISDRLDIYKNSTESNADLEYDTENIPVYNFNGSRYGKLYNVKNTSEYNNFTLSFFGTRKNWIVEDSYMLGGNYLDTGFGIINNHKTNVLSHYFTGTVLNFINDVGDKVLTIDIKKFLYRQNDDIAFQDSIFSVWYRSPVDNFYIVTKFGYIFEYTANGTIVDSVVGLDFLSGIRSVSTSYTPNYGVILDNTGRVYRIDFKTNLLISIPLKDIVLVNCTEILNASDGSYSIAFNFANKAHVIKGNSPIFKNNKLYFKDNDNTKIYMYDTNTTEKFTYIDKGTESIKAFTFNLQDETVLLYTSGHDVYDIKGEFKETVSLKSSIEGLSSLNMGNLYYGEENTISVQGISKNKNLYFYNIDYKKFNKVESDYNVIIPSYNVTFDNYIQSILSSIYPLPGYSFRIKLNNIVNQEETITLETNILGETLDTGTHHFAIVLDTHKGFYRVYLDGFLYSEKIFTKGKYVFNDKIREENIVFGCTPFYGGLAYNSFFKSNKTVLFVKDLKIEKLRYYNMPLNSDEIKMEYLSKINTSDVYIDIECGSRNYLDTISRVFKNKTPGQKANLINIYVNDSLVKDTALQDAYNNIILKEAYKYLPGHVKINKIIWNNNKKNFETMLEGFFNTENTLTES